jgi:hypothetical protein
VAGNLNVTTAPLTITANNQSTVYGAALPTLTVSYNGFVNGDSSVSLGTQPTLTTNATAASHVAGNPHSITASGASGSNYAISYVAGNLRVTSRPLTITADAQSRIYGNANPALTYMLGGLGLVNGDALTGQLATSATANSAAGRYDITQGNLAASSN